MSVIIRPYNHEYLVLAYQNMPCPTQRLMLHFCDTLDAAIQAILHVSLLQYLLLRNYETITTCHICSTLWFAQF